MASPIDLLERYLKRNNWRKVAEMIFSSLAGAGFGTPGGPVTTTSASGATRNTLDDGSGNAIFSANVTVDGTLLASGLTELFGGMRWRTTLQTTTYPTVTTDIVVLCDATSGAFTVTLNSRAPLSSPDILVVKKVDSTANHVTLVDGGGADIDGSASLILTAQNESVLLIYGQTNWYVLAANAGAIV